MHTDSLVQINDLLMIVLLLTVLFVLVCGVSAMGPKTNGITRAPYWVYLASAVVFVAAMYVFNHTKKEVGRREDLLWEEEMRRRGRENSNFSSTCS
jgi:hypothetical protein